MKRPPGLWLLLSAGVLWLSMQNVYGIRATALIFGRGPTTSTTEAPASEESLVADNKTVTSADNSTSSSTNTTLPANATRTLTGIPQIDYIYDPNLPRELNGYNLSEYPFYHRVPVEIEFKCDGLHDGFYASVPHKCQVYHHCLFGTRFDFLCANYTAFDQKTFICHFVSEVDCNNSHKFWHRNDALYQAATTTTIAPPKTTTTTTTPPPPPPSDSVRPANGNGGRRRKPFRRPRPQYDYYDDEDYESEYYEPPPPRQRGRRKRPRPRPRPIYDVEYDEEYEDDRYDRRGPGRRGAADRDRRPYEDRQQYDKKRPNDDRRHNEDKPSDEEDRRPSKNEDRRPTKRRPSDERNYETPNRNDKHSRDDDYYEDEPSNTRANIRPNKNKHVNEENEDIAEKPVVKPVSGSAIYGQPRKAPRIRPPVPKNEQNKYNYKAMSNSKTTTTAAPVKQTEETDYYEYEEEDLPPSRSKPRQKTGNTNSPPKRPTTSSERSEVKETTKTTDYGSRPRGGSRKPVEDYNEEEIEEERPKLRRPYRYRPKGRNEGGNRKRPAVDDDSLNEEEMETAKSQSKKSTARTESRFSEQEPEKNEQTTRASQKAKEKYQSQPKTTERNIEATTAKTESGKGHHQSYVRVVKRPFLPSRSGNPYSPRGLKPVGAKSLEDKRTPENSPEVKVKEENLPKHQEIVNEEEEDIYEDTLITNNQNEETEKHQDEKPVSVNLQKQSKSETPTKSLPNENTDDISSSQYNIPVETPQQVNQKSLFKPSPQIIKIPMENKYVDEPYVEASHEEEIKPIRNHHETLVRPNFKAKFPESLTTTNKPVYDEKIPLDIPDDEYDVTLNEAINPTLPNLPIRSYPTGFSNTQGYPYNNFQRPRTNQQFKPSYQIRPTNHGSIIVPHDDSSAYLSSESGYNPNLSEEAQIYRPQNFRSSPHVTQVRTQPFYY